MQKSSYKVILEEMTEKKKKLHTTVGLRSDLTDAPSGYTFVAAGDPKITSKCKELSRAQAVKVYIVSTSGTSNLSEQVGRVGYHFPSRIVNEACRLLGSRLPVIGGVDFELESGSRSMRHTRSSAQAVPARREHQRSAVIDLVEDEMSQDELDAKATSTIRELFPKIPELDVQQIVTRAFRRGTAKVGTATDQPFIRRVHLAVGAHIRHMYTDYDELLRSRKHGWLDARAMVQPITLDKIIEWRDEKDEPDAVEDILREVIVIPDDEDDEIEDNITSDRQDSVEVISSHEFSDTVHVKPLDYGALDGGSRLDQLVSSEDDWDPSVKFIRRVSTPPAEKRREHQDRLDRQQAHRNRIWREAVSRRKNTAQTSHGMATRHAYQPHDKRLAPSNPTYPQLASADRQDRNGEYSQSGQHTNGTQAILSTIAYNHNPDHQVYLAHDKFNGEQISPRTSVGLHKAPAVSRFVPPESERIIPSVESDPHAFRRQKPSPEGDIPGPSSLQDRFVGPRIIELDDSPRTPTIKRRRVEEVNRSTNVAYQAVTRHVSPEPAPSSYGPPQRTGYSIPESDISGASRSRPFRYDQDPPRRVELVPIVRSSYNAVNDGPMKDIVHHHNGGTAHIAQTSQPYPSTRPLYEPPSGSPLQHARVDPHKRFSAAPNSRSLTFNPKPPSEMDRLQQPILSTYENLPASYFTEHRPEAAPNEFVPRISYKVQNMPGRLRPLHPNEEGVSMYAGGKPALDDSYWVQTGIQASNTEARGSTYGPAHVNREDDHTVRRNLQPPVALLPRDVHRQDLHPYVGEKFLNVPQHVATIGRHRNDPDHEVVYITSSPPGGER
ncbi:MAG: hypothetical protein Q9209_000123 [Squamulea sp. 1 TL-2023]